MWRCFPGQDGESLFSLLQGNDLNNKSPVKTLLSSNNDVPLLFYHSLGMHLPLQPA